MEPNPERSRLNSTTRLVGLGITAIPIIEGTARFLNSRDLWGIPEVAVGIIAAAYLIRRGSEGGTNHQEAQVRDGARQVIENHNALRSRSRQDPSGTEVGLGCLGLSIIVGLLIWGGSCINSSVSPRGFFSLNREAEHQYFQDSSAFERSNNVTCQVDWVEVFCRPVSR